ncbi:MAG: hypothetical protein WC752_04595 [Patescibacteria group bacterium]|jgi:hypothetical protein
MDIEQMQELIWLRDASWALQNGRHVDMAAYLRVAEANGFVKPSEEFCVVQIGEAARKKINENAHEFVWGNR